MFYQVLGRELPVFDRALKPFNFFISTKENDKTIENNLGDKHLDSNIINQLEKCNKTSGHTPGKFFSDNECKDDPDTMEEENDEKINYYKSFY